MSDLDKAKAIMLQEIDQLAADLKKGVEAINSETDLEKAGSAKAITEELLKTVTGGIHSSSYQYHNASSGVSAPSGAASAASWKHEQNNKMMLANLDRMATNSRLFFEGKWSQIDHSYDHDYHK